MTATYWLRTSPRALCTWYGCTAADRERLVRDGWSQVDVAAFEVLRLTGESVATKVGPGQGS
jgi:hypothetical protein